MQYEVKTPGDAFAPMPDLSFTSSNNLLPVQSPPDHRPFVLVLSEDEDAGFLYRTLLEMWSYTVEVVPSFEKMSETAETNPPALFLVEGSVRFEKTLDGIRRLRADRRFGTTPIILVSGFVQPQFRRRALTGGANDFLIKPLDFDLFERCVKINIGERFSRPAI